jgi:hypothetical protein
MPDLIVKSHEVASAFKIAEFMQDTKRGTCHEIIVTDIDEDSVMQALWDIKHTLPSNYYKIIVHQMPFKSYNNSRKFKIIIQKISMTSSPTPFDSVTVVFAD